MELDVVVRVHRHKCILLFTFKLFHFCTLYLMYFMYIMCGGACSGAAPGFHLYEVYNDFLGSRYLRRYGYSK